MRIRGGVVEAAHNVLDAAIGVRIALSIDDPWQAADLARNLATLAGSLDRTLASWVTENPHGPLTPVDDLDPDSDVDDFDEGLDAPTAPTGPSAGISGSFRPPRPARTLLIGVRSAP